MTSARRLEMIELTGPGARVMIWIYFLTNVALAIWTLDGVRAPLATLLALVLAAAVWIAVTRDTGNRLSFGVTSIAIGVGVATCLLVSWELTYLGYTQWYVGNAVVSFFYVSLRGRILLAWIGFGAIAIVILIWGITTDIGFAAALYYIAKQSPILIVGTLFATGLRRTGNLVERLTVEASSRAVAAATASAVARERQHRLLGISSIALPLLERIAREAVPTDSERREFAVAEAELRDSLRARSLLLPDVMAAARSARSRGVEVVLLDDSSPRHLGTGDLARAAMHIAAAINAAKDGQVVARLLPPGRTAIATIVSDGSRYSRFDVPAAL